VQKLTPRTPITSRLVNSINSLARIRKIKGGMLPISLKWAITVHGF
jgi:hypothetical protein